MKEINGRKYYDENEVELMRLYGGMGRHIIYLKNKQKIDILFDACNINNNDSEKLRYWRYKKFSSLGYRLSMAASILKNEIVAIEYLNKE